MYYVNNLPTTIEIGYTGETNFRTIQIDMSAWMEIMPSGIPSIVHIRPGEDMEDAYIAGTTFENNILTWTIQASDIGPYEGTGLAQVWLEENQNSSLDKVGMSAVFATVVWQAVSDMGTETPSAQIPWMQQMTALKNQTIGAKEAAETAQTAAESAAYAAAEAATAAGPNALISEGYAVGKQHEVPVESGPYWHNNSQYYCEEAAISATDAETAQGKAEDAQTAAETAQGKAEDAQTAAETAQGKAEDAQTAAETAQGKAEDAQEAAETAQGAAEDAQDAAEDAQTAAETAQSAAEAAAATASAAYNVNLLAPNFVQGTANANGSHVISNGGYYELPNGHTAGETWENTTKKQTTVGEEITDLKSEFSELEDTTLDFLTLEVESGYWDGSDGTAKTNTALVRSEGFIEFKRATYTYCDTGYRYILLLYNNDLTSFTSTGFVTSYTIPANTKVKVAQMGNPSILLVTDYQEFAKHFHRKTIITEMQGDISNNHKDILLNQQQALLLSQYGVFPLTTDVEIGNYDANGVKQNSTSRIRTKGSLIFQFDITIKCDSPYSFAVLEKSGSTWVSTSWETTYTVTAGTEFKFVGRQSPESTISDPVAYAINFYVGRYPKQLDYKIDSVKEEQKHNIDLNQQQATILSQTGTMPLTADVELGSYNGASKQNSDSRIRSKDSLLFSFDITINCESPYSFVLIIKNGSTWEGTEWVRTYTVTAGTEFKFVGRKSPETTISDPVEFAKNFIIGAYTKEEIDKINLRIPKFARLITNKIISIAHRGLLTGYPENTPYPFTAAKRANFDAIETDVRWTSDNVAVILHDDTINRTGRNPDGSEISGTIKISDITYAQALEYDFGIYMGEQFAGTKIMTLDELLSLCKKLGIIPFIEIKMGTTATNTNIHAMAEKIVAEGLEENVAIGSYYPYFLNMFAEVTKRVLLVVASDNNPETPTLGTWEEDKENILFMQSNGCRVIYGVYFLRFNSTMVAWLKAHNVPLYIFTVDSDRRSWVLSDMDNYVTYILSNDTNWTEVIRDNLYSMLDDE